MAGRRVGCRTGARVPRRESRAEKTGREVRFGEKAWHGVESLDRSEEKV